MNFKVDYAGSQSHTFFAPQEDEILKHWRKGNYYEARKGELLDLIYPYDIGCYVDIGAHWGNHAAFMAPRVKELHLFEPRKDSIQVLKVNTKQWAEKCHYYEFAIGDEKGTVGLEQMHENNVGSTKATKSAYGSVYLLALDTIITERVDFIKIDVEGMEIPVLIGSAMTIMLHKPIVSVEVAENEAQIDKFMSDLGYKARGTKNATKTKLYLPK